MKFFGNNPAATPARKNPANARFDVLPIRAEGAKEDAPPIRWRLVLRDRRYKAKDRPKSPAERAAVSAAEAKRDRRAARNRAAS